MTQFFQSKLAALALAGALTTMGGVALAGTTAGQAADGAPSVTVQYGDLDIGHAAGAKILLQRIEFASGQVCGGPPDIRLLDARSRYQACKAKAFANGLATLNAPLVNQLADAHRQPMVEASR